MKDSIESLEPWRVIHRPLKVGPFAEDHALLDSVARFSGCGLCFALLIGRRLVVPGLLRRSQLGARSVLLVAAKLCCRRRPGER